MRRYHEPTSNPDDDNRCMSLLLSAAALALVTTSPLPRGSITRGTGGRAGPLRMADGRTAVSSTASLPGTSPAAAYQTLAAPANWPGLLLFCASAELVNGAKGGLLKKGATVEEFAGLVPPLGAPLTWECRVADSKRGLLVLDALNYPGPASDVELAITVSSDGGASPDPNPDPNPNPNQVSSDGGTLTQPNPNLNPGPNPNPNPDPKQVSSDGGSGSTVEIGASYQGEGPLGAVVGPALGKFVS